MRSFMKFSPDKIGLYLDWRTQEVGIAAARSGDAALINRATFTSLKASRRWDSLRLLTPNWQTRLPDTITIIGLDGDDVIAATSVAVRALFSMGTS